MGLLTSSESKIGGGRGKETLFRVTIRNQIDQISIADNKANMIISINTIIISLVVAIMGAGITGPYFSQNQIAIPFTILLIASAVSAVFSILAAKPRMRRGKPNYKNSSLLFFGNFKHMPMSEFLDEMEELLKSKENVYRTLSIDLYNYGMILDRKYRMLSYSYTSFLVGIIATAIAYILVFFINWM